MMYKALVFTALLAATSNAENLRMTPRQLSYEPIAGYEPGTSVTDHNAIDRDQKAMEDQLGKKTDSGFSAARNIYQNGGNSKSFARIRPTSGTTQIQVNAKDEITGEGVDGRTVTGKAMDTYAIGSEFIDVQYTTSDVQASYSQCQVGGLETTNESGCFVGTGTLTTPAGNMAYASVENMNARTIQGFSLGADTKMRVNQDVNNKYYADFQKFVNYYGDFDYANDFVTAAFDKVPAALNGKTFDFSNYGFDGRSEAIKKGAAYMNTAMYVIREMEDALDDCKKACPTCNDDAVHALDEAVAFYTGSLEDGTGSGVQMYALAEKRCKNFRTCGSNGDSQDGNSRVNTLIFEDFNRMQSKLVQGNQCDAARAIKERIVNQMFVPLVQGTLRYAWKLQNEARTEKAEAEGAAFAAAVLPMVNACSESDAATIYSNMRPGSGAPDFAAVKRAFENNYGCLNINCQDVGGLYEDGQYLAGASPCGGSGSSSSSSVNVGLAVGVSIGVVAALGLIACFCMRRKKAKAAQTDFKSEVEFKSESTDPDNHQI